MGRIGLKNIYNVEYLKSSAYGNDFNYAVTQIGATPKKLVVTEPLTEVASSVTTPNTLEIIFEGGGSLNAGSGINVTIGRMQRHPGSRKIFNGNGTFALAKNAINSDFDFAWWFDELDGSGMTVISTAMWNGIKNSFINNNGGRGAVPNGIHKNGFDLELPDFGVEIYGWSANEGFTPSSIIRPTADGVNGFKSTPLARNHVIKNIIVDLVNSPTGVGHLMEGANGDKALIGIRRERFHVQGGRAAVRLNDTSGEKSLLMNLQVDESCSYLGQLVGCFEGNTVNGSLDVSNCNLTPANNGVADVFHFDAAPQLNARGNTYNGQYIGDVQTRQIYFASGDVNTSTNVITKASHAEIKSGDPVYVSSTTTLPGGLAIKTRYFIHKSGSSITLHRVGHEGISGDNPIDLTSGGTGTHTIHTMRPILVYTTTFAASAVNTSTNAITSDFSNFVNGLRVRATTTGTLPGGLAVDTDYYVNILNGTLHTSSANAIAGTSPIDITTQGTGNHTLAWGRPRSILYLNGNFAHIKIDGSQDEGFGYSALFDASTPEKRSHSVMLHGTACNAIIHSKNANIDVHVDGGNNLPRSWTDEVNTKMRVYSKAPGGYTYGVGGPHLTVAGHEAEYPYPLDNFIGGNSGHSGSMFVIDDTFEGGRKSQTWLEHHLCGDLDNAYVDRAVASIMRYTADRPLLEWGLANAFGGTDEKRWMEIIGGSGLKSGWTLFESIFRGWIDAADGVDLGRHISYKGRIANELLTDLGSGWDIDPRIGSVFEKTVSGNGTLTISDMAHALPGQFLELHIVATTTTGTVTFDGTDFRRSTATLVTGTTPGTYILTFREAHGCFKEISRSPLLT